MPIPLHENAPEDVKPDSAETDRLFKAAHREYASLTGFDPDNYTAIVNKLIDAGAVRLDFGENGPLRGHESDGETEGGQRDVE